MQKLLICGDSFAADWTVKFKESYGWVNLLSKEYKVTNLAQAGCSEYKILKQLQSVNLKYYDKIIVSHTSPYRLYTDRHPVHYKDSLHQNSCLIYSDINEHVNNFPELRSLKDFFENYFSFEYAEHTHNLLCAEIENYCPSFTLHVTNIDWKNLYNFKNWLELKNIFENYRGSINHYNEVGNKIVFEKITERLQT
jgi:hypothetical protein